MNKKDFLTVYQYNARTKDTILKSSGAADSKTITRTAPGEAAAILTEFGYTHGEIDFIMFLHEE